MPEIQVQTGARRNFTPVTRSLSYHVLLERWNAVEADRRVGPGVGARTLKLDPVTDLQVLRQRIGRVLVEHVEFFAGR